MRRLLELLFGSFRSLFSWFPAFARGCGEVASGAADVVGGVAGAVVETGVRLAVLPFSLLFGGNGQPAAAQNGAQQQAAAQQAKDAEDSKRAMVDAVRLACFARASGREIDPAVAGVIQKTVLAYIRAITPEECKVLAACKNDALRAFLESRSVPEGVRSPEAVSRTLKATLPAGSIRKGDGIDDVMATYEAAAAIPAPKKAAAPVAKDPDAGKPLSATGVISKDYDAFGDAEKLPFTLPASVPAVDIGTDGDDDGRAVFRAVREVCIARGFGKPVPMEAAALLPASVTGYLSALTKAECKAIGLARTADLRVLVETRRAPEGVRGPDEVTEPTRASEVREDHRLVRNAVRSVAAARARGLPVPEDAAARLQHTVKAYLAALDPEECGIIAKCKPGQMSDLLENRRAPEGVRNPAAMANVLRTNGSVPRQALEYDEDLDDTMRTFTLAPV